MRYGWGMLLCGDKYTYFDYDGVMVVSTQMYTHTHKTDEI